MTNCGAGGHSKRAQTRCLKVAKSKIAANIVAIELPPGLSHLCALEADDPRTTLSRAEKVGCYRPSGCTAWVIEKSW